MFAFRFWAFFSESIIVSEIEPKFDKGYVSPDESLLYVSPDETFYYGQP